MTRFVREFVLIPLPFGTVSVFFFLGEVPGMGIFFAIITAAALFYVRPRKLGPPKAPELVALEDPSVASPGVPAENLGSGPGSTPGT